MHGLFFFFAVLLACLTSSARGYLTCGNGVVDYNETCDTALTVCCNISCSGVHDFTEIDFAQPTCFAGTYNYAQLSPLLTVHTGYEFTWMFSQIPGGATPSILTPHEQSTYFTFNSNGVYVLSVQIATPSCGTYYTEDFTFTIDDCCGNGVLDNGETCDKAALTNGCCDSTYCSFTVEGTPCDGDIHDQCTHQLACDGAGQCVSTENRPYTLTALQTQNVVDETCAANVRTFTFQTSIEDPLDNTPGDYYWYVTVLGSTNSQHTVVTTEGLVEGPTATVSYSIKTVGGGSIFTRLTVIDPCGLVETIDYNVTRECCGNGVLNTNEACDTNGDPYCSSDCSYVDGWCGDAIVQEHEFCDYKLNACCSTTCSSYLPSSTLCRMSRGDCDLAEYCTGSGPDCPEDAFKPATHICRNALGLCDAPETCSGSDPDCPNQNDPLPAGTLCRAAPGVCANDMYCDGLSYGCALTTYKNSTCRPAIGSCDTPEYCQQGSPNCPADLYLAENTSCANASFCFLGGQCPGNGPYCSLEVFLDNCTNASAASNTSNPCDESSCFDGNTFCVFGNTTNACTIDNQCFPHGATNPNNECQYCDATVNLFVWSTFADGTVCTTLTPEGACSGVDVCMLGVCVDQYKASDVICRSNVGSCDEVEYCTGDSDVCPQDLYKNSSTTCRFASGECDVPETCTGYSPYCPADRVFSNSTLCRGVAGPCDVPETCDGVNKVCPVDLFKSARVMCRSATGICDRPEYCTGEDAFCPLDEHYGPELVCREATASCDAEERCTGHGSACPPDLYANATRICRPANGACDRPEYCTGTSLYCPFDAVKTHGEVCRVSRGGCDPEEVCTGSSKQCPKDEVSCAGTLCRAATGPCDKEEYCDGESFTCPEDEFRGPRFICRLKQGKCDVEEYCTLGTAECPDDVYLDAGEVCRPSKGRCDLEEQCTGDSAFCPPDEKAEAGVECRSAAGVCSRPGVCSGVDDFCPENCFASSDEVCREPVGECDQPEYCTGHHPDCPEDLRASTNTMCSVPDGPCAKPAFCLANGTCPNGDLFYNSDHLCHVAQSQCDYNAYCTGNSSECPYYPEDVVIEAPCVSSGLTCRNDFCSDVNECSLGDLSSCSCSSNAQCEVTDDSCLVGYCANFFCQRTVVPGKCFIDGMCLNAGDHNPYNYCQLCRPSFSPLMWASEEAGTHCNTGADEGDCSAQDTCNADGVCVDNYHVGRVCRESVSICDLEEMCVHGNDWCPEDEVRPGSFVCRASVGDCDLPEQCDGHSPYCPSDVFYPSTHVCRLPSDLCDNAEKCTGESAFCPRDVLKPKGAVCRERCGSCDIEEVCNGEDRHCPVDRVQPSSWVCRAGVGDCDRPETCDGVSRYCPADELFPNGTVCRHRVDTCDKEEVCDGSSVDCPVDLFAESTQICRIAESSCDIPEFCTGYTNSCPNDEVRAAGFICRPSLAACDHPEECDGESNVCPEDIYYPNTHVCRPASSKCDIEDRCTGLDVQCPYDARRPDGYPCADNAFCNGDELCFGGVCQPASGIRNCSRPRPCRLDSCDESTEMCVHATHDNIGQLCYTGPDDTLDVGTCRAGTWSCNDSGDLVCVGQRLPKDFDFCGNDKDDDCNGLVDDGCWTGPCTNDTQCINSPIDTCHTGHCNTTTSKCIYTLNENTCFIDDHCQLTNDYKIHNPCLRCFPNVSTDEWVQQNQADVSNGNICDGVEKCQNGKVVIDTKPLHCHRLNGPCQKGVCDPISGCYVELLPNGTQCERSGHECSVAFTCVGGQCICDGIEQVGTTEGRVIELLGVILGSLLIAAVVVFIMLDVRYHPEKIKPY